MVNCQAALWNLVAGTYTIVVSPPDGGSELSFKPYLMAELIEPPLTANSPVTLNVSEPQVQRYTFTAHAGDNYALQVSGVSGQPITVAVYSPTVSSITLNDYLATMTTGSSQQLSLSNLPATGTYTVLVGAGAGGPSSTGQMTLLSQ
jgi:hypothetical protein